MGKIIDWLWNNTASPEVQETCMIDAYGYETSQQAHYVQEWETSTENLDEGKGREVLLETMRERNRLRTELESRGYSYDGESFYREEEEESGDDEEDTDDEEEQPQRGFFSRLIFG